MNGLCPICHQSLSLWEGEGELSNAASNEREEEIVIQFAQWSPCTCVLWEEQQLSMGGK